MPRVKINSIHLYYEITGAGLPVVFLNGLTMDVNGWLFQVEPFSRKYRVLRYDCRDQGQSDKPTSNIRRKTTPWISKTFSTSWKYRNRILSVYLTAA